MPHFEAFNGIRYRLGAVSPDDVIAPPYDVVDPAERARLVSRSPYNSILIELPEPDPTAGLDAYENARRYFAEWQNNGVLVADIEPAFYGYRMIFARPDGTGRSTTGVIGALGLEPPSTGQVLPHEVTTPKAKTDRAELLRATGANLSPIWALTPTRGLAGLAGEPNAGAVSAVDDDGITHQCWVIDDPARRLEISALVASAPVVIADGHHRYEVALAHHQATPSGPRGDATEGSGSGYVMALVVELVPEQLSVDAIHRLISGLPDGFDLTSAMAEFFDLEPSPAFDSQIHERMATGGALALMTATGAWLMRPNPATSAAAADDLDSCRLDVALAALPDHEISYQHGWDRVATAIGSGAAQAGVLLRPATVDQVAATASGQVRMPPKTTYFHPKPRTGMVFRSF